MSNVLDLVPEDLRAEVDSALAWFNAHENASFEVTGSADLPAVRWLGLDHVQDSLGVAELDPPPGARKTWLADLAGQHSFAVLLFYRGFW